MKGTQLKEYVSTLYEMETLSYQQEQLNKNLLSRKNSLISEPQKPGGRAISALIILAVAVVEDVRGAIDHIATHSTGHSEAILTRSEENAALFTRAVDSAAVYVNASTCFMDGGEFGLGCEMGISTQKLHARGPMGLEELTSYKYVIRGNGQIR